MLSNPKKRNYLENFVWLLCTRIKIICGRSGYNEVVFIEKQKESETVSGHLNDGNGYFGCTVFLLIVRLFCENTCQGNQLSEYAVTNMKTVPALERKSL